MAPLFEIRNLVKDYPLKTGLLASVTGRVEVAHAVSDVSFQIEAGEIIGVVGESGSGKTTLGKVLVQLERPTSGVIAFEGAALGATRRRRDMRNFRRSVQMIFQDPYDTLNPRHTILDNVVLPLRYLGIDANAAARRARAFRALEMVELDPDKFAGRYPHQLSGGQRQRVAIARALIVEPRFVVADEPVSMLDVSIRAGILNLLKRLNGELGIAMLLITHDLTTAYYLSHRIAVMYLGKIVEFGVAASLIAHPYHPYSQLLLASAPDLMNPGRKRPPLSGEAANAIVPPAGCRFSPRCPFTIDLCRRQEPPLAAVKGGHLAACHRAEEIAAMQ